MKSRFRMIKCSAGVFCACIAVAWSSNAAHAQNLRQFVAMNLELSNARELGRNSPNKVDWRGSMEKRQHDKG